MLRGSGKEKNMVNDGLAEGHLARVQNESDGYSLRREVSDENLTVPGIVAGRFELPPRYGTLRVREEARYLR
ncbi:MAG TPA: hypothetical protein VHY22_19090 [Chthoniobacteraceae bacterium]|nr:hypothetical protein [Chthoniobacteraceae bacterium]